MAELSVPLLNRLVDAMLERADPKADQNIWDLARAAEEVVREVKGEQLTAAYGGPRSTAASELAAEIKRQGTTGRMTVNPVPLTQVKWARGGETTARLVANAPDYAAQLGEVERRLMLKAPQYTLGDTAYKVDQLAQDYQAAVQAFEQAKNKVTELSEKNVTANDVISQIREALDPDGQYEDESLIILARERMSQRADLSKELAQLHQRIGTQIEANSAEMLRRVLGAHEHETLGQAAKRVAESEGSGWKQFHKLNDLQNNRFHQLNRKIREIVAAVDESESDDYYMPEQPTTDAVRRVVARLILVDQHPDGSRKSASEILGGVQGVWDGQVELPQFSWERRHTDPKPEYSGPRYVVRKSSDNPDFDDWAVWDKQNGDWFTAVDVGSKNEAERRAAGLNETEDA